MNVAYNVVNEKTTYGLLKALSNLYEKPSSSNKVFFIRQLVNTKMKEGASIADHVNEFNSILSRLMSVDINFNYEVQALLLLTSLPESWSGTVTIVNGCTGSTKLNFDNICDFILGEDIRKKASREYSNSLLNAEEKGRGIKQDKGQKQNRSRSKSKKRDYGASCHATYCKEELEWFKLCSDFRNQQWKVTKGSLVVARWNKHGSLYMVEVPSDGINATIDDRGNAALWHQRLGHINKKGFQITKEEWQGNEVSLAHLRVFGCDSYVKVKDVARDKLDVNSMKDITFNEDSLYGVKASTDSSNLTKPNQKDQVVLEDSPENLVNKSIVTEHGLSSEIIQGQCGSSDTSEGSKNNGSFDDSGRSNEEDSKDKAFFEEGGSKTLQLQRSTRESKALVRLVLSIVATENLHLEKLDVKTAFLHGDIDEDIYMTEPEGFQSVGKEENLMYKLKKSLYGLKQAPRQWYSQFDGFMQWAGYKRCAMDHCCYLKKVGSSSIIVLLYVDDMLVACSKMAEIKKLKRQLSLEFEMKDLDRKDAKARCQPLGDHFKLGKKQAPKMEASTQRIAKVPYASAVGSKMYTMVCTRPDIAHAMGVATLCFSRNEVVLKGFSESDYEGCLDSGKSTTAEYMAIEEVSKELKILGAKNPTDMFTNLVTTKKLKLYAALTGLRDN
nr:retrovirus-related Pol polyprotein from transposon TNT 1-94 [Tanacetum cinerariifolium]